jgi:hypothetical protein
MMRAWNAMRLDFAVPGNHEFDFGEEVARERFAESRFPWLAANLHAEPPLPMLRATELRELGGVRLGFLGLITPETATLSKPGPRIRFEDHSAGRSSLRLRTRLDGSAGQVPDGPEQLVEAELAPTHVCSTGNKRTRSRAR